MPSTAVASRKNSWNRIKHKYKTHTREYYAKRMAKALHKEKQIALNKARSKMR